MRVSEGTATFRTINARVRRRRHPDVRRYRRNERTILGIAGVASFFLIWQVGAMTGLIDPFFFSSPGAVLIAGFEEVQIPRFWNDVKVSAFELGVGAFAAF